MVSTLFHNNLAAELAAVRQKNQELEQELERVTRQRDLIKSKWEDLDARVEQLQSLIDGSRDQLH